MWGVELPLAALSAKLVANFGSPSVVMLMAVCMDEASVDVDVHERARPRQTRECVRPVPRHDTMLRVRPARLKYRDINVLVRIP